MTSINGAPESQTLENKNTENSRTTFSPLTDLLLMDWKKIPYQKAWDRQKERVEARIRDEISDQVIFCEHPAIITLGRGSQRVHQTPETFPADIETVKIERGGMATYHGPGQIVVYPIVKMAKPDSAPYAKLGILGLIRSLERWAISFLQAQGLDAVQIPEKTGVWVLGPLGPRKIASIGIAARHWVSYHGMALNFGTGLEPWKGFNPCGFQSDIMTDLSLETGKAWTYDEVKMGLREHLPAFWTNQ